MKKIDEIFCLSFVTEFHRKQNEGKTHIFE